MRTRNLKTERQRHGWGQVEAAKRLGVSQPYLAMLERGKRRLTPTLARRVVSVYGLPPAELPTTDGFTPAKGVGGQYFVEHLSRLGYPGFAYVHPHVKGRHPGEVLLTALAQESLEGRVAESLPWLVLRFWDMNSDWLMIEAKKFDLQNRLGFVVSLARQLSERSAQSDRTEALANLESSLERSRLAREDYFYRPPRNHHEREWLSQNRSDEADHWNLLSDLRPDHLQYVE